MDRKYYLDLAATGLSMPVGTDLVLHESGDRATILLDGDRLGRVVEAATRRYRTPLAFPLMDLSVEKEAIARVFDENIKEHASFHFVEALDAITLDRTIRELSTIETSRMKANCDALCWIDKRTDLVPVGMSIGPFSLMTKLIADPIAPIYMAGMGTGADEDAEVLLVEQCLAISMSIIANSITRQAAAGAKAIFVCEPAANLAYISPKQLAKGSDIFERYVMLPNRKIAALLNELGVDLIFHDCGELTDSMVGEFGSLNPAMLSLGCSRVLWEDAARVPKTTVLYGNLPSKKFYSDSEMPLTEVTRLATELSAKMKLAGHPFILGSECDVLCVNGAEKTINAKVAAFVCGH